MYALEIENLNYTYPDCTPALMGISLKVRKAHKTAILGTNGSGKTTLIYHINGILTAQEGTVKVAGSVVEKNSLNFVRRQVGLLFDNPDNQLFSTTVYSDIAFGPRNLDLSSEEVVRRVNHALEQLSIIELAERPPYSLSLGQKKRASIAGLIAMEPQILVCDEPFSGLDPAVSRQFKDVLDRLIAGGTTLIFSTHDVDLAYAWADEVVVMKNGSILGAGSVDLLQNEKLMNEACLPLPILARLFGKSKYQPRTVEEAIILLKEGSKENIFFG
jgi:cobalt/nickel transport system ATP-binding protein